MFVDKLVSLFYIFGWLWGYLLLVGKEGIEFRKVTTYYDIVCWWQVSTCQCLSAKSSPFLTVIPHLNVSYQWHTKE